MKVTQIYSILNEVIPSVLGTEAVGEINTSNMIDVGTQIIDNANAKDHYVKALLNRVGREVYVTRRYEGFAPKNMLFDSWEYGSILEKVSPKLFDFSENKTWGLTNGTEYEAHKFYQPEVTVKLFNERTTYQVKCSFTDIQLKESFTSEQSMNSFLSMIYVAIDNTFTLAFDELKMLTIDNFIAQTFYKDYPLLTGYGDTTKNRTVNLLKIYNDTYNKTLTKAMCFTDSDFLRFTVQHLLKYKSRISGASDLFNIGGETRFTNESDCDIVMLTDYVSAVNVVMQSGIFNKELVQLPTAETVPYWQGSGTDYDFDSVSTIHLTIKDTTSEVAGATKSVNVSGILAVMYDHNALGVCNLNSRVTSEYTPSAEFYTNYYKNDVGFFNDFNENFVVFYVADESTP